MKEKYIQIYIMNKMVYNGYSGMLFLFIILCIAVIGSLVSKEGFSNNHNLQNAAPYSKSKRRQDGRILDSYPATNNRNVNSNQYNDIWWYLPIFKVGSFAQITNNLRYRKNPDNGRCIDANFCGTLYKDDMVQSNIVKQLPPVTQGGVRVNYYNS